MEKCNYNNKIRFPRVYYTIITAKSTVYKVADNELFWIDVEIQSKWTAIIYIYYIGYI